MKIIKEGDVKRLDKTRRFECSDCGCIWEATAFEYRREQGRYNETMIGCKCPTCRKEVWRDYDEKWTG